MLLPVIHHFGMLGAAITAVGAQYLERIIIFFKAARTVEADWSDVRLYHDMFKVAGVSIVAGVAAYLVRNLINPNLLIPQNSGRRRCDHGDLPSRHVLPAAARMGDAFTREDFRNFAEPVVDLEARRHRLTATSRRLNRQMRSRSRDVMKGIPSSVPVISFCDAPDEVAIKLTIRGAGLARSRTRKSWQRRIPSAM